MGSRGRVEAIPGGRLERRQRERKIRRRRRRSAAGEVPVIIVVALLIALGVKTFALQAFVIPSGSMEQTIKIGDRVVVDKFSPWFGAEPHRGDVVVFKDPGNWLQSETGFEKNDDPPVVKQVKAGLTWIGLLPSDRDQDLIKRVVGVGGDRVRCCDAQGRLTVNGAPIVEPYLYPGDVPSLTKFDVKVPQGRIFVMGDHRSDSADSRAHLKGPYQGTVPEDLVVGKAMAIAWPVGHWRRLEDPDTYASVPEPHAGATRVSSGMMRGSYANGPQVVGQPPTPAELPLVMGVVGLHRLWCRRRDSLRSGCGGRGSGRTLRAGRVRRASGGGSRPRGGG
ncbi:signal peptidase I [Streptomyces polyrhachis]|uniref:Signal peptidase I n=1 Tax=Streptomyces polyrhachis TaxID=1282885 RepID=A0ABW2GHF2_9ACTN